MTESIDNTDVIYAATRTRKNISTCEFCGGPVHNRSNCPARNKDVNSKHEGRVEIAYLIHSDGNYAQIKNSDGRELNVSTRKLAPYLRTPLERSSVHPSLGDYSTPVCSTHERNVEHNRPSDIRDEYSSLNRRSTISDTINQSSVNDMETVLPTRTSNRSRRMPEYLKDYILDCSIKPPLYSYYNINIHMVGLLDRGGYLT
ncbi:hypothetical protein GJ496_000041 [Pomphorhynchus laevis]|nr:hypothetical protein GJ496_000041 [Pomphorhynchus laevis]